MARGSNASLTIDTRALQRMGRIFSDKSVTQKIDEVRRGRAIAALIGQAIAENFEQEGPGWAPLKAATIRRSVTNKKLKKQISEMTDAEILAYEAKARRHGATEIPHRKILQKTGLLKKSASVPGFSGKGGGNIWKVEGTKITFGTNLIYAATHEHGDPKRNIPARPFMELKGAGHSRVKDYFIAQCLKIVRDVIRMAQRNG